MQLSDPARRSYRAVLQAPGKKLRAILKGREERKGQFRKRAVLANVLRRHACRTKLPPKKF